MVFKFGCKNQIDFFLKTILISLQKGNLFIYAIYKWQGDFSMLLVGNSNIQEIFDEFYFKES